MSGTNGNISDIGAGECAIGADESGTDPGVEVTRASNLVMGSDDFPIGGSIAAPGP